MVAEDRAQRLLTTIISFRPRLSPATPRAAIMAGLLAPQDVAVINSRWEDIYFIIMSRRKLCLEPSVVVTQLEKFILLWIFFAVIRNELTEKEVG